MNRLALILLLLIPALVQAQIAGAVQIGNSITKDELTNALRIVDAAKPSVFQWNKGDFEIIQKGPKAKGELTWEVSDDTIVAVKEVPAKTLLWVDAIRAGSKEAKLWEFAEQVDSYYFFRAVKEGTTQILIFANGDKKPVCIARMTITVGKPAPKPDDPPVIIPDDPLTQKLRVAANADYVAGKSDKKILLPLAGIYEGAAAGDFPATVVTCGDLDNLLYQARKNAGLPEADVIYPTLRKAIQQEIYARLGIDTNSSNVKLTEDTKRLAKLTFGKIAASLEALTK